MANMWMGFIFEKDFESVYRKCTCAYDVAKRYVAKFTENLMSQAMLPIISFLVIADVIHTVLTWGRDREGFECVTTFFFKHIKRLQATAWFLLMGMPHMMLLEALIMLVMGT